MNPFQTSYGAEPTAGLPGQLRANIPGEQIGSKAATEEIPFGRLCVYDADAKKVKLPDLAADVTNLSAGFAIQDTSRQQNSSGSGAYQTQEMVSLLKVGQIFVETIDAAPFNGLVYVVVGAGANQGKVASTAVGGTLLKGARFVETVLAVAGTCIVEYNHLGN